MKSKPKLFCHECGWSGFEVLRSHNPFKLPDKKEIILGCPGCLDINTLIRACDYPECDRKANCGFPIKDGYKFTCEEHYKLMKNEIRNLQKTT